MADAEVLRLRKELIHARETIEDLQEELRLTDEKCLRLQDECEQKEILAQQAREDLSRIDTIVEQRVAERLEEEIRNKEILEELLRERNETIDQLKEEQEKLLNRERALLKDYTYLKSKMEETMGGNFEIQEALRNAKHMREEQEKKERELEDVVAQLNILSKQTEDLIAENRVLREMANTPENFGIPINEIKLAEKDKIEEYKVKLRHYEEEIHALERERAILKARLRERPRIPGKEEFTAGLTGEQIMLVEQFILDLREGRSFEYGSGDLKQENQRLRQEIARLQKGDQGDIEQIIDRALNKRVPQRPEDTTTLAQIRKENVELLRSIRELLKSRAGEGEHGQLSRLVFPPVPVKKFDGSVVEGRSFRFPDEPIPVVPFDVARYTGNRVSKEEFAFVQLCLVEAVELSARKDGELKLYTRDFRKVGERIRSFILQRNELYKSYAKEVNYWKDQEKGLKDQNAELTDLLRAERIKNNDLEKLLATLRLNLKDSELKQKLIELSKKSSIFEVSVMQLTRKYITLQQEYKLMHHQYMNIERDNKEKELQMEERIARLKEWKEKAVLELKYLYDKLRSSVSLARYERQRRELDVLKEKETRWLETTQELMLAKSERIELEKARAKADQRLQEAESVLADADQELQIVQERLKRKDPEYAYERSILERAVTAFRMQRKSIAELFEDYDKSHTGALSKEGFRSLLKSVGADLSSTDFDALMRFVDVDAVGMVRYRSFMRTLRRAGVKSRRREDEIIARAAETIKRTGIDLQKAFEVVDRDRNNLINKQEMLDALESMRLDIKEEDLQSVISYIYPEGTPTLDYRRFCRVFEKTMQEQIKEETKAKETWKLEILRKIDEKLMEQHIPLNSAFPSRRDNTVTADDFAELCERLHIKVSARELSELFADFDKKGIGKAVYADVIAGIVMAKGSRGAERSSSSDISAKYASDNNVESLKTKIMILLEREKIALERYRRENEQTKMLEELVRKRTNDCEAIEKDYKQLSANYFRLQETSIANEAKLANCITKEESLELRRKHETAEKDLLDRSAAMQTYKSMYEVLLQQMRSLELAFGRRQDEAQELHKALLQLQSANDRDNLVGKLYYVVLLSRWQEAATNRKHDRVVNDLKLARSSLYTAETENATKDSNISHLESILQNSTETISQLNEQLSERENAEYTREKVRELTGRMKDLIQAKIDSELANIKLREENTDLGYSIDRLQLEKRQAQELAEVLRYRSEAEIAQRYAELSDSVGGIKLAELRAQRDARMLKEKEIYLERVNEESLKQIRKLEEELGNAVESLKKAEETFRMKDKERETLFFELKKQKRIEETISKPKSSLVEPVQSSANAELMKLLKERDETIERLKQQLVRSRGSEGDDDIGYEISQDKEKRQMADVAYKTVKTLESIIGNQREQLSRKDGFIKEIRDETHKEREELLKEIARLQEDLADVNRHRAKRSGPLPSEIKEDSRYEEEIRRRDKELRELRSKAGREESKTKLQKDLDKAKRDLGRRTSDYNALKETITKLKAEMDKYSATQNKQDNDITAYATREKAAEREKAKLEQQLRRANKEIEELKTDLNTANMKLMEQEAKEPHKEVVIEKSTPGEKLKSAPMQNNAEVVRENARLRKELRGLKIRDSNDPLLKVNEENLVIESTVVKDVGGKYIDEIIETSRENIHPAIVPINNFDVHSNDLLTIDKAEFEKSCACIGLKYDEDALRTVLQRLELNGLIHYKEFALALKGVPFKKLVDSELLIIGQMVVDRNLKHAELSNYFSSSMFSESELAQAISDAFRLEKKSSLTIYMLERAKHQVGDQYNAIKLLHLIEQATKTCLIEDLRKKIGNTEGANAFFKNVEVTSDRKMSKEQLADLLSSVGMELGGSSFDYLWEALEPENERAVNFDRCCDLLLINPELRDQVRTDEESKLRQELSKKSHEIAKSIVTYLASEERLLEHFTEQDANSMGILSYIDALNALLKIPVRGLRKSEVLVLLRDLDVYRMRQFCYHFLAKKIFEVGWDGSGLAEIYRKILNACNRKGTSLNTRSGFQKAFAAKTGNAMLGPSQFKSTLSDIAPSLLNSELRTLEDRFKGEKGRIQLDSFIDELFASEGRKGSSIAEYSKVRKESISGPAGAQQKSLKGKLEEVKKENEVLRRENYALLEKVAKLEKAVASAKTTLGRPVDAGYKAVRAGSNEDSARILELEKNNYELMKKIDTDFKPQIERYKSSIENLKSEVKVLKLENLKHQSQLEKLLKRPMDGVEKKHELDYMRENKLAAQEKKIVQLGEELARAEQKVFELHQTKQELMYEKENFALERSRLERRIKDLELFLSEAK